MDSMSLGSREDRGLVVLLPSPIFSDVPEMGIPSKTYKGSLAAFKEVPPLILTLKPASGPPSEATTCTPAILLANCSSKVSDFIFSNSFDLIDPIAPVKSSLFKVP